MDDILTKIDKRGVATITLNRPDRHNAFDDVIVRDLHAIFRQYDREDKVRVVVLAAKGKSFSAGADLNWMRRMATFSTEENLADALAMAKFFKTLATLRKPTIAVVQGAAFGGGVGLVATCDIGITTDNANFSLSEVKLGLIPAVVSPYINRAIGIRAAQRYYLTGEKFAAQEALRLGLVHRVVEPEALGEATDHFCRLFLRNSSQAMAAVKTRLAFFRGNHLDELGKYTAQCIAEIRTSPEGREGVAAFLEKRLPTWVVKDV